MNTLESIRKANNVEALDKIKHVIEYNVMFTKVND